MIRKISLCLFIIITIGSLVPFLSSCGDIINDPHTNCLTNSTVFWGGGGPTVKKRVVSDYIKDECESGISVGNTVSVFGKSWKIINFSRPFNECFTDFDNFTTVTNTNSNFVLLIIPYTNHKIYPFVNIMCDSSFPVRIWLRTPPLPEPQMDAVSRWPTARNSRTDQKFPEPSEILIVASIWEPGKGKPSAAV